jgi:cytosolic carboxypeptidase protein 2/3
VHPGETPGSWMMQGFLKCITGDSHQAVQLRKRIVFKVIPMVNPDGVIIGNYRTSLAGCDLNRRYDYPDYRFHPTVWSIKNLTEDLQNGKTFINIDKPQVVEDNVLAFIDMHGHSRKKSVFMYGPSVPMHNMQYLKMRVIPRLLAEETDMFRYHSCRFQNEPNKKGTARVLINKEFNVTNCFTLEASFHGYFDRDNINYEFTPQRYEEMGVNLVNSLYEYVVIMEQEEKRRHEKKVAKTKRAKLLSKAVMNAPSGNAV